MAKKSMKKLDQNWDLQKFRQVFTGNAIKTAIIQIIVWNF